MSIHWTDTTKTEPCMPCFNELEYYVGRSRVWGIHDAYYKAEKEVIKDHNDFCEIIRNLHDENQRLKSKVNELTKADISANVNIKSSLIIMRGRKPRKLNDMQIEKAQRMKQDGMKFSAIAHQFDVSERTIRRVLA